MVEPLNPWLKKKSIYGDGLNLLFPLSSGIISTALCCTYIYIYYIYIYIIYIYYIYILYIYILYIYTLNQAWDNKWLNLTAWLMVSSNTSPHMLYINPIDVHNVWCVRELHLLRPLKPFPKNLPCHPRHVAGGLRAFTGVDHLTLWRVGDSKCKVWKYNSLVSNYTWMIAGNTCAIIPISFNWWLVQS